MTCPPLRIRVQSPSTDTPDRLLELAGPSVLVGRGRAAQVRLPAADVSAAHARVQWTSGGLQVEDLGSENGTRCGSRPLAPGRTYPLAWGEPLQIADYRLTVLDPAAGATPSLLGEAGTATLAAHLVRDMAGARDSARLRVQGPTGPERTVSLAPGAQVRLGRDPGCDVQLKDPDLSREHAEIRMSAEGATLRDLVSKNGITVNGEDWSGTAPGPLHHGDAIRLGGSEVWFEDPAEALLAALNRSGDPDAADSSSQTPRSELGIDAAPAPDVDPPTPSPTSPSHPRASRPQPVTGQLGRTVLIGFGLALMGAAGALLWWLFA